MQHCQEGAALSEGTRAKSLTLSLAQIGCSTVVVSAALCEGWAGDHLHGFKRRAHDQVQGALVGSVLPAGDLQHVLVIQLRAEHAAC